MARLLSCWAHLLPLGSFPRHSHPPWALLLNFRNSLNTKSPFKNQQGLALGEESRKGGGWFPLILGMALLGNPQFQIPIPGLHLSWECPISEVTQRDLVLAAPEGISYFLFPTVYLLLFFFIFWGWIEAGSGNKESEWWVLCWTRLVTQSSCLRGRESVPGDWRKLRSQQQNVLWGGGDTRGCLQKLGWQKSDPGKGRAVPWKGRCVRRC